MRALLPQLAGAVVGRVERVADRVVITASAAGTQASCPRCATAATRVHSRYERRVADAPISGVPVVIELGVRRFFCDHPVCPKRTFAEQIPGLTSRYARRSLGLGQMLAAVGLAADDPPAPRPAGRRGGRTRGGRLRATPRPRLRHRADRHGLRNEQVERYLDLAGQQGYDAIIALSKDLAPVGGMHPVAIDGRKLRKVALHHISWSDLTRLRLVRPFGAPGPCEGVV